MRTTAITALIIMLIGSYPAYAHRVVNAAQEMICNIIPVHTQPVVTFCVFLVAIVALAQQGQGK